MAKRRRNTYGDFRRPIASESSDLGMTNDYERREDDNESRTTEGSSTNLSGSLNFEQSGNLEHQSHSNMSAAVSPRTTMEDTHVPHLVTHNLLDRDENEPLTATRITMDLDSGASEANNDDVPSSVTSGLFNSTQETIYNTQDQSMNSNSNLQIQDNSFNTPESNCPEMDASLLSVYATPNYLHTPLHTPQLTSTPMSAALPATAISTPQINTPDPQDHMRNYGLGLHIPEPTCMGLTMNNMPYPLQQSMLQHSQALHGLASPPRSITHPIVTSAAPSSATLTSMQFGKPHHQQMLHGSGHQRHLSMPQMDSYPSIDMPMATSSSRFGQHDMLMHGGGNVPISGLQESESGHHLAALHHGGVHAGFSWGS
jgi:hypothetical protein